jgi:undecaprenyl-diphosphatase
MGSVLNAILLGIIQGITEFLPISSSGHLELAKYFLGEEAIGEESLFFTVVLHFATALSTIVVFRKEIWQILRDLFSYEMNDGKKFALMILISMIPAVFVGLVFEDFIASLFNQNIYMVGGMLIVTGFLLILADRAKTSLKGVSALNALIIGIAQALAIMPGLSRSGATVSASVLLGIDRTKAASFSFLMVVPLIFGKIILDVSADDFQVADTQLHMLGIGFVSAFISGMLACHLMVKLIKISKLKYFSIYCFIIAIVSMLWFANS